MYGKPNSDSERKMRLEPVRRMETLGDQACSALRTALRRGILVPGERLVTRQVAATLNVSMTPAREALNRLVAERVLAMAPDRTVVVPVLTRTRYNELYLIRLELEGLAARLACDQISPPEIDHLKELYGSHGKAFRGRDAKRCLQLNEDFHFSIYTASRVQTLVEMLESIWLQVGPSINLLFPGAFDEGWRGGVHHRHMLEAINRLDPAALEAAVRQDLKEGRERLNQILPEEASD